MAIPVHPWLVPLGAVAAHAAGDHVAGHREPAVRLGDDVIERRTAIQIRAAIGAAVVPGEEDLITR